MSEIYNSNNTGSVEMQKREKIKFVMNYVLLALVVGVSSFNCLPKKDEGFQMMQTMNYTLRW